jgi:2-keto-3-deoxy-L-rhamnonate aldolase RhmA
MATLHERVRAGELTRGTFLNMGSALAAEVCALSGFDWLLVDLEHGAGGEEAMVSQFFAGEAHNVAMLVRVESAERIRASHALDMGAAGVMFPRLDTPDEVTVALSHLWYPPRGDRGIANYNRARRFGSDTRSRDEVNDDVLSVVQIESRSALESVEQIAHLPGVDVLFVGPSDLSTDLGIPGQLQSPVFLEAMQRVVAATKDAGNTAGVLAADVAQGQWYIDMGFRFLGVGSDSSLLGDAATAAATPT